MLNINRKCLPVAIALALSAGCAQLPDKLDPDLEVGQDSDLPKEIRDRRLDSRQSLPAVEYRPYDKDYYTISRMTKSEPLPDVGVKTLSVDNASVYDALRMLLLDLDINLAMSYEVANKTGMYVAHGSGSLQSIIQEVAKATNLFYTYRNKTLTFSETESFVFKIPPVLDEKSEESMAKALFALGVEEAAIDPRFNTVTFRTTPNKLDGIRAYLQQVAKTGSVVVFDAWIWEVALNEGQNTGIKWENFNLASGDTELSLSGGGVSIPDPTNANNLVGAITHTAENLSLTSLVSFLKSQGELNTLSQPKISVLSGSSASLEIGEEQKYVSELTSTTSSSGDTTQSSAETDTLSTGLKMNIMGSYESDSVFSNLTLEISDLLRFQDFQASGTTLSLPHTMIRKVKTETRVEPGEYFIIGGVNMSRQQKDDKGAPSFFGIPGISIPFSRANTTEKSELVIVMRPRVIVFGDNPNPSEPTIIEADSSAKKSSDKKEGSDK